jgi:hypothetical protein
MRNHIGIAVTANTVTRRDAILRQESLLMMRVKDTAVILYGNITKSQVRTIKSTKEIIPTIPLFLGPDLDPAGLDLIETRDLIGIKIEESKKN